MGDINDGAGCEACGWNTNREAHMVTIRAAADGTPTVWADPCIADLVRALNAAGFRTVASCCGHRSDVGPSVMVEWPPPFLPTARLSGDDCKSALDDVDTLPCDAPSGWHDDGDPMCCVRPDGHTDRHWHPDLGSWNECAGNPDRGCILAEGHEGQHYDPSIDSSFAGTAFDRMST